MFKLITQLIPLLYGPPTSFGDSYICISEGVTYTTKSPDGWLLDNESGKSDGLCLVGYPKGGSWKNSETVIYLNSTTKGSKVGNRNIKEMIEYDVKQHKANLSNLNVTDGEGLLNNNIKVQTKYFSDDSKSGNYEAVSYIDTPKAVVFIVMTSRTEQGFKKALTAFKTITENFLPLPSSVIFSK